MRNTTTHRTVRSRHLRRQAPQVHPIVAQAFRRRASEIELHAFLTAAVSTAPSH